MSDEERERDFDQHSAGGLVVRGKEILLIELDGGRRWQLPKGHLEAGESVLDAAHREVLEETGIDGKKVAPIGHLVFEFGGPGAAAFANGSTTSSSPIAVARPPTTPAKR